MLACDNVFGHLTSSFATSVVNSMSLSISFSRVSQKIDKETEVTQALNGANQE